MTNVTSIQSRFWTYYSISDMSASSSTSLCQVMEEPVYMIFWLLHCTPTTKIWWIYAGVRHICLQNVVHSNLCQATITFLFLWTLLIIFSNNAFNSNSPASHIYAARDFVGHIEFFVHLRKAPLLLYHSRRELEKRKAEKLVPIKIVIRMKSWIFKIVRKNTRC